MRKSLALVLGIVLGAALSAPAFAESPVTFSGYVKVFHESLSNFTRQTENPVDRDNFFENKLQIKVTFQPADNVKVVWQFRGPSYQRWGSTNPDNNSTDLYTRGLYGELNFDWGNIRGGVILDGLPGTVGGLASLGYAPAWGDEFLFANPFDPNSPANALTYDNKWDLAAGGQFGLAVYYVKLADNALNDGLGYNGDEVEAGPYPDIFLYTQVGSAYVHKDIDIDVFGVEASYEWETGGVSLGLEYQRNMTDPVVSKDYAVFINPAFVQSFGPFAVHFEAKIGWGERTYNKSMLDATGLAAWNGFETFYLGVPADTWDGTIENKGLGLYLDGVYTYDQGDVTLAAWYVSGSNLNEKRGSLNSLVDMGDFAPFLVAYNDQTLGTGYYTNNLGAGFAPGVFNFNSGQRNHWGIAILGNHTIIPDKIKMNYGIGYFQLVKPSMVCIDAGGGDFSPAPFVPAGTYPSSRYPSKDLGWEIDLGFTFQILESVWLETEFGYFFNGDAFETFDLVSHTWRDPKDTFAWATVLAFEF